MQTRYPGPSPLQGWPRASGLATYFLLTLASALLFGLHPEVDLLVSRWAQAWSGGRFQTQDGWWWWLYYGIRPLVVGFGVAVVLLGFASLLRRRPLLGITPRRAAYAIVTLLVAQGLVVDLYLKGLFGRARPRDVLELGGERSFTPFYQVADQCVRNCSFTSGHAAMAFAAYLLVWLVPPAWRRPTFWAVTAFGLLTGWMRILQGGHFLSDVVFAGLVTYGLSWLLARVMLARDPVAEKTA